jgi:hypothetical protein
MGCVEKLAVPETTQGTPLSICLDDPFTERDLM